MEGGWEPVESFSSTCAVPSASSCAADGCNHFVVDDERGVIAEGYFEHDFKGAISGGCADNLDIGWLSGLCGFSHDDGCEFMCDAVEEGSRDILP